MLLLGELLLACLQPLPQLIHIKQHPITLHHLLHPLKHLPQPLMLPIQPIQITLQHFQPPPQLSVLVTLVRPLHDPVD